MARNRNSSPRPTRPKTHYSPPPVHMKHSRSAQQPHHPTTPQTTYSGSGLGSAFAGSMVGSMAGSYLGNKLAGSSENTSTSTTPNYQSSNHTCQESISFIQKCLEENRYDYNTCRSSIDDMINKCKI